MKRFLIPAFFVVHGETELEATEIAVLMQGAANDRARAIMVGPTNFCFVDEELPTKEVPIHPDETELPHTYNMDEQQRRDEKHGLYCEHEDIAN